MQEKFLALFFTAREKALSGIDFYSKKGAVCPLCRQKKITVITTRAWRGVARIRYHRCQNQSCLLSKNNCTIKSIETKKSEDD